MPAFGKFFNGLAAEGVQIVRASTGHDAFIAHNFAIDPVGTGIPQIGLKAGPGSDRAIADNIRLHQQPGTMANRSDGFSLFEKRANERHGSLTRKAIFFPRSELSDIIMLLPSGIRQQANPSHLRSTGLKAMQVLCQRRACRQ